MRKAGRRCCLLVLAFAVQCFLFLHEIQGQLDLANEAAGGEANAETTEVPSNDSSLRIEPHAASVPGTDATHATHATTAARVGTAADTTLPDPEATTPDASGAQLFGADYECTKHTSCLECAAAPDKQCGWCIGGVDDGTCQFHCESDVTRIVERESECAAKSCSSFSVCEECIDYKSGFTDCQWCLGSGKCGDFWERRTGCDDSQRIRISSREGPARCPRRGGDLAFETTWGTCGLLIIYCMVPIFFCRCCLYPCVCCCDRLVYPWRFVLLYFVRAKGGEWGTKKLNAIRSAARGEKDPFKLKRFQATKVAHDQI